MDLNKKYSHAEVTYFNMQQTIWLFLVAIVFSSFTELHLKPFLFGALIGSVVNWLLARYYSRKEEAK